MNKKFRFPKGCVSVKQYKNGLRIRWRKDKTRPELYIPSTLPHYHGSALIIKEIIERDLIVNEYDESLVRYKELKRKAAYKGLNEVPGVESCHLPERTEFADNNHICVRGLTEEQELATFTIQADDSKSEPTKLYAKNLMLEESIKISFSFHDAKTVSIRILQVKTN